MFTVTDDTTFKHMLIDFYNDPKRMDINGCLEHQMVSKMLSIHDFLVKGILWSY